MPAEGRMFPCVAGFWLAAVACLLATQAPAQASILSTPVQQVEPSFPPDTAQQPTGDPTSVSAAQRERLAREEAAGSTLAERAISLLGLVVFLAISWGMSEARAAIRWRTVAWGIGLQFFFAIIVLRTDIGGAFFQWMNDAFVLLLSYTTEGARFIFGNLVMNNVPVGPADGPMSDLTATGTWASTGAFFAFSVLPTIIFFSSLMGVLYYLGVMQLVVRGFAKVMVRTMGTSGAESLSAAGNIFLGQTEAPLLVRPFLRTMTSSELHAVMCAGFATVAGGVLAAYVGMLTGYFPTIAGHLIAASVMSTFSALVVSKLMLPETGDPETSGEVRTDLKSDDVNVIDAAARGAADGLKLAVNVGAMLLAFIALLALANGIVGWAGGLVGFPNLSIQLVLGWMCAPLAWLMGVPWQDAMSVGVLIGEKTALNEFVAFLHLAQMLESGAELSARSVVIATYALAGFANFSSIAIQIGGIGAMAPERRGDLSRLGLRAMIAGSLATFMTASVVGMLL